MGERSQKEEEKKEENKEEKTEEVALVGKLIKHDDGQFTILLAELIRELWISKSRSLTPLGLYEVFTKIVPHFCGFT